MPDPDKVLFYTNPALYCFAKMADFGGYGSGAKGRMKIHMDPGKERMKMYRICLDHGKGRMKIFMDPGQGGGMKIYFCVSTDTSIITVILFMFDYSF